MTAAMISPTSRAVERIHVDRAIGFLRHRCSALQSALYHADACRRTLSEEDQIANAWTTVFDQFPDPRCQQTLTDLVRLHGEVVGRLERGGVGDVSPTVEELVRAAIVDRLQAATDQAVAAITAAS